MNCIEYSIFKHEELILLILYCPSLSLWESNVGCDHSISTYWYAWLSNKPKPIVIMTSQRGASMLISVSGHLCNPTSWMGIPNNI